MSSAPSSARTSKNKLDTTSAPRVVGQIYEGLVSKKVEEAMLTSLYGCCYMVRLAGDESNPVLKFSQNLIPEEVRDAASDEALRASLDTYRELSRACFLQAMRGFRRFHARWWQWTREAEEARDKARLKVAQEKKVSAFEGAAPVRTSWVTRLELLLTDAVEIAGQLLKLDWSINLLSSW
ncbi:hypothetical protein FA15DRAFT_452938 [Coprinopsis marcescibilis]|uniref:Uncharacterized protein n=1 Tax=Coprinopsis marcescibilis TaxID=230819 RepID=A0A5C3K8N9_COPMA|nr:hypothetical protein FA15DRAFT_452938 [Coprinopsis marcescibilis]